MLLAMFTLVVLTFFVMFILAAVRIKSVIGKEVPGKYYRLMQGFDVPAYVTKPTRQFSNLFETPVLFYLAGILFVVMDIQSAVAIYAAWSYVGLRVIHAGIHLTYNHPLHRLAVFALSMACVFILWLILILSA